MMSILKLLRVHQWTKNFFIFAAAFFGGVIFEEHIIIHLLSGFLCFCGIASTVYILNDLRDLENDRLHPEKCRRPIASGAIGISTAWIFFTMLAVSSLIGAYFISVNFLIVISIYFFMNIAYSFGLKKIALVDIAIVSFGFILRVLAGGVISGVEVSHWLFIMTFLLALFLAIAKRRDDLVLMESTGTELRKSIKGYNMEFVNVAMGMMGAVIVVGYILYITSPEITQRFPDKRLYVSVFFVILGLLRYLQITLVERKSGSPTQVLMKDLFIQLTIISWVSYFALVIYFLHNGQK